MEKSSLGRSRNSKRNSTACEHCRTAKAKCQPSKQLGVCEKCLGSRRECISRTRPRPRRSQRTLRTGEREPLPQALGQPSTFSIDHFVHARSSGEDCHVTIQGMHDSAFEIILNEEESIGKMQMKSRRASGSSSSVQSSSIPIPDVWRKAQFSMASAESLLKDFNSMLEYFPLMVFSIESTVTYLADTKPFVLLAVLCVASRSRTPQKHALYDDEFLRVLGLRYVFAGEKSLQLLQGLLIYCAWYPFHLKPRTSQLARCMRMATDIVHDLGLDENFLTPDPWGHGVTEEELDKIRAYLGYAYLVTTYVVVWKGNGYLNTRLPPWVGIATDILKQNARVEGDHTLSALVRLSCLCSDASEAINGREKHTLWNGRLIMMGLEQQHQQIQKDIQTTSPTVVEKGPVWLQTRFLDIYLDAGSLISFPVIKTSSSVKITTFTPPMSKIRKATKNLRVFLDYISELDDMSLLSFTVNDWTRLIIVLTLSYRLSFPLSLCPDFDWIWANSEIQLDQFLSKILSKTSTTDVSNGILSANRAVLSVLKSKYNRRLSSLGEPFAGRKSRISGCPVMSGRVDLAIGQWNSVSSEMLGTLTDSEVPEVIPMFHDVWPTVASELQDFDDTHWHLFDDRFTEYR